MKQLLCMIAACAICLSALAQKKSVPKKEKPPTQAEMSEMMKEAQQLMNGLSEEDKKMMDSLGIKMPDLGKVPKVSDKQLADAWEDENRVVPKRDAARIASIPKSLPNARMETYIAAVQKRIMGSLDAGLISMGDAIFTEIRQKAGNNADAGKMAAIFWAAGQPELALYLLGKVCTLDPENADNLGNFAAMLSMQGGQHLAIPLLNNLNAKFPRNSTLLNNLGQAWFGLGELTKAEAYIDSALKLYPYHPQANMTRAAMEQHKGNTEKAREAIKKSIQHAYTKDKEDKLVKLGQQLNYKGYRMPLRTKADPMNLGGFHPPAFPVSVDECVGDLGMQWTEFIKDIDGKTAQLQHLRESLNETALKGQQQRMNADIALVKNAAANPAAYQGQSFVSATMYHDRAAKRLKAYTDLYEKKLALFAQKVTAFATGEQKSLKDAYEAEMKKLKEEDGEQTGEGKPNKSYCPKYKKATDDFLKALNPKLESLYKEYLQMYKELLNEMAHWNMYMQWPDMFEVMKIDFQINWLAALKKGYGTHSYNSTYPYVSITAFVCDPPQVKGTGKKLREFDDFACQYKSNVNFGVVKMQTNCSHTTTTYDLGKVKFTERELGEKYIGGTLKLSPKVSAGGKAGPLTVEGFIGSDITVELDGKNEVKDWSGTATAGVETSGGVTKGPVKVGASVTTAVEIEIGSKGVGDVNLVTSGKMEVGAGTEVQVGEKTAEIGRSVDFGIENRVSVISGHGSVTGTGLLSGVTLSQW